MVNFPLLVVAVSFVALVLSVQMGDALRKRVRRAQANDGNDFGIVLNGALTLLGLIIGFSISMAMTRYDLRKNCEQAEANAIAIEYIRSDLLPGGEATRLRKLLNNYLDQRVLFYTTRDQDKVSKIVDDTAKLQNQLWAAVRSAIAAVPPPLMGILVSGMNDVVLSQRCTQAAWWNRIPVSVWALLGVVSMGCSFLIGYRARQTDWLVFLIMPIAVSISLFLIADLDSPRGGAIRVAPQNLSTLSQSLRSQ